MKTDKHKTKVIFMYNAYNDDYYAYFPDTLEKGFYDCYAKIGQHSKVSEKYVRESINIEKHEYKDLKNELEQLGYNLEICK